MFGAMLARSSSSGKQALLRRGSDPERKVAILGAAGRIGQPFGLLMKLVSYQSLYDIADTPGVAADGSRVNARSEAAVITISNPLNSTFRIASEVFKKACTYDEKKPCGVRAKTFYAGFGTGLCVARSVAASLACRRHFTTKLEIPESAKVIDASSAVFECIIKPPGSEEQTYVLKVSWPLTEQDEDRLEKFEEETGEKLNAAVAKTLQKAEENMKKKAEEKNKPVEDKK